MSQIKHRFIAVTYQLYVDRAGEEKLEEETPQGQTLKFYTGFGMVLEAFEQQLVDLPQDKMYDITLTPAEGYGEYRPEHVVNIPRMSFCDPKGNFDDEHVYQNAIIPLENEDGTRFMGRVVELTDEHVRVDLNHPLAGRTLHFTGIVKENREATDEELARFLNQMNEDHCCCGGCGGEGGCGGDRGCEGGCHK